jgi:hypothetical protein
MAVGRGTVLSVAVIVAACDQSAPTGVELREVDAQFAPLSTEVGDLAVAQMMSRSLAVSWTQIDDGTGNPARYRVKYGSPLGAWRTATVGCKEVVGDAIGEPISCFIAGLQAATEYEIQLASFRTVDGVWADAKFSNVAIGSTTPYTGAVDDLRPRVRNGIEDITSTAVTLTWTQVDDGTGTAARYRVKYATPTIGSWRDATIGCQVRGWDDHSAIECAIQSLTPSTDYEFQLMSYRLVDGVWQNARYSNKTQARTLD